MKNTPEPPPGRPRVRRDRHSTGPGAGRRPYPCHIPPPMTLAASPPSCPKPRATRKAYSPMPNASRRLPLFAAALLAPPSALAREITPDQAPAAWVAYAQDATRIITAQLNADTPPVPRIRAVLDAMRPAPDQPPPPLVVKIWVGRAGAVTRAEFPPLADAQADQDLHALLQGQRLSPPPRGMRQPMRLGLQLEPRPADSAAPAGPGDRAATAGEVAL